MCPPVVGAGASGFRFRFGRPCVSRTVALIQRIIGRGFRCHPRPMTRWGSLSLVRWGRSLRSRPHRTSSPLDAVALRSSSSPVAPAPPPKVVSARGKALPPLRSGTAFSSLGAKPCPQRAYLSATAYRCPLIMPSAPPPCALRSPSLTNRTGKSAVLACPLRAPRGRLRVRGLPLSAPPPLVITPCAPLLCALRAHGGTEPPLAGSPVPARFRGAGSPVPAFPPPRPLRGRAVSRHKGGAFLIG